MTHSGSLNSASDRLSEAARSFSDSLNNAGFDAEVEDTHPDSSIECIRVARGGRPLGHVHVRMNGEVPEPSFDHIYVSDYVEAVIEACFDYSRRAEELARKADVHFDLSNVSDHVYVAAVEEEGRSYYCLVLERDGERVAELTGSSTNTIDAEFNGVTDFLERCDDLGVQRTALHVSPEVLMAAQNTSSPVFDVTAYCWIGDYASGECFADVVWLLRDTNARGYQYARYQALHAKEQAITKAAEEKAMAEAYVKLLAKRAAESPTKRTATVDDFDDDLPF